MGGGGPQISRGGGHTRHIRLATSDQHRKCVSPDHSSIILDNHSTKQILLPPRERRKIALNLLLIFSHIHLIFFKILSFRIHPSIYLLFIVFLP